MLAFRSSDFISAGFQAKYRYYHMYNSKKNPLNIDLVVAEPVLMAMNEVLQLHHISNATRQ